MPKGYLRAPRGSASSARRGGEPEQDRRHFGLDPFNRDEDRSEGQAPIKSTINNIFDCKLLNREQKQGLTNALD